MANKTDVYFYEWSEKLSKYSKKNVLHLYDKN